MTDKDTGGSAFPVTEFSADDEKGMDLRDYLAGHALSVPILSGLTDRVHPRRILLIGAAFSGLSSLGYALFASIRYRVFGRLDECRVPAPEERARFLA